MKTVFKICLFVGFCLCAVSVPARAKSVDAKPKPDF